MSSATSLETVPESLPTEPSTVRSLARSLAIRPLQFAGFWTGVLAPLAYPVLLLGGLDAHSVLLLLGVVACNVLGLLLGREYRDHA